MYIFRHFIRQRLPILKFHNDNLQVSVQVQSHVDAQPFFKVTKGSSTEAIDVTQMPTDGDILKKLLKIDSQ